MIALNNYPATAFLYEHLLQGVQELVTMNGIRAWGSGDWGSYLFVTGIREKVDVLGFRVCILFATRCISAWGSLYRTTELVSRIASGLVRHA